MFNVHSGKTGPQLQVNLRWVFLRLTVLLPNLLRGLGSKGVLDGAKVQQWRGQIAIFGFLK